MQVNKFLKKNILIQKSQILYARLHCVFFQAPVVAKLLDSQGSAPFLRIWDGRQVIFSLAYYVLDIQYTYCRPSLHTIMGLLIKRNFLYILGGIT